jgi:hypothetical protein
MFQANRVWEKELSVMWFGSPLPIHNANKDLGSKILQDGSSDSGLKASKTTKSISNASTETKPLLSSFRAPM